MADKEEQDPDNLSTKTVEAADLASNEEVPQPLESAAADTSASNPEASSSSEKESKITVLLKATGNAPIMGRKKWTIAADKTIGGITQFMRNYLKKDLGDDDRLILYINQTFSPTNDQTIKNLYDCYGSDGKLIIHYSRGLAWG